MPEEQESDAQAQQVAELFEQHRAAVFAYLARMTRDAALAEEVTQETFLKVYAARAKLPGIENARAWIFRIAINTCSTTLKRNRRFRWLNFEDAEGEGARSANDSQRQLMEHDAVERALGALSEEYRAPLLLFGHYGFHVAEIADMLGISEGAVKTRVYRAKEMFIRAYRQGEVE
ncbi:MAG: RNA polymerase sigma factor [Anaerolineae bacterium]|jgi:RNA polymerase sigma-70 factor (ECF subfamily)|nr:RNA polymerase sigma factor [Anaerolineae bacterium]